MERATKKNKKTKGKQPRKGKSLTQISHATKDNSGMVVFHEENVNKMVFFKDIFPARVCSRMKYIVNGILNNAGFTSASRQMRANGCYDIDPAFVSTALPGFNEAMQIWQRYRVHRVRSACVFVNRDNAPCLVNLAFDSIAFAANAKSLTTFANSNSITKLIGGTNCEPQVLSLTCSPLEVIGDKSVYDDADYTGTSGSNPPSLFYTSVAIDSQSATVLVNGVAIRWEIWFDVEFFQRRNLVA